MLPEDKKSFQDNPLWETRYKRYWFAEGIDPALKALFRMVEHPLQRSRVVKNSRSTSAGIISVENKKYFVKRSNVNSFWERFRRIGRLPRSERNALIATRLEAINVRTPKVYMSLATGPRWLPAASYLITEALAEPLCVSQQLPELCQFYGGRQALIKAMCDLMYKMHAGGVEHGDLKLSNWLVERKGSADWQLGVFDLDGSCVYAGSCPEKICIKELARAASSFCIYSLRNNIIQQHEVEEVRVLWCKAYAQAGGRDYSSLRSFTQRFNSFMTGKK